MHGDPFARALGYTSWSDYLSHLAPGHMHGAPGYVYVGKDKADAVSARLQQLPL